MNCDFPASLISQKKKNTKGTTESTLGGGGFGMNEEHFGEQDNIDDEETVPVRDFIPSAARVSHSFRPRVFRHSDCSSTARAIYRLENLFASKR